MKRAANGRSSIYEGGDGRWHGRVSMGTGPDGRDDRRHVTAKSQSAVAKKVRQLEKARDAGEVAATGLPDALNSVWPKTIAQACVVHLIRRTASATPRARTGPSSPRTSSPIYTAPTEAAALERLAEFAARIRKAVKARGHFPNEQAALKCVYLAIMSLDPTGRGRQRWSNRWKGALNASTIAFPDRIVLSTK